MRRAIYALLAPAVLALPASAQVGRPVAADNAVVPLRALAFGAAGTSATPVDTSHPLPTIGKQESFQLAAANTSAGAFTVAGGDYILTQLCSGYGSLALEVLGPDATSWLPLASYTVADTGSGHGFALGSYAQVRVTLSGTTGCAALLARVPS